MSEIDKYLIRDAVESDAQSIISVHQNAVHITAKTFYDQEILDEWSPKDISRVSKMREKLHDNPENNVIIVIEINGIVAGFGEISPSQCELRAVYVDPKYGKRGLGKSLLAELETRARNWGLTKLQLDASINAQDFYIRNGFLLESHGTHKLASGRLMPCIKMSKNLL